MADVLDSNILLYALGDDEPKRERAWELLGSAPTISTQIVNECSHVLRRKARWSPDQVARELTVLIGVVCLVEVRLEHVYSAWALAKRYGFSHFDSLVIATAMDAGCARLYTEDLQHGQVIDGQLTIFNPFLSNRDGETTGVE